MASGNDVDVDARGGCSGSLIDPIDVDVLVAADGSNNGAAKFQRLGILEAAVWFLFVYQHFRWDYRKIDIGRFAVAA